MIKVPNLYILSTVLVLLALVILAVTEIHFVVVYMLLGVLAYIPNFILGSYYGLKITKYLRENKPGLYKQNQSSYRFRGVILVSHKMYKDKIAIRDLDSENIYILRKYAQSFGNIIYTFILIILSLLFASFYIIN